MRYTDTFAPWVDGYFGEYELAANMLAKLTGTQVGLWRVITDTYQTSTRENGKSGCAYLVFNFDDVDRAVASLRTIHAQMPQVNCELLLAPDGLYDKGDGPGTVKHAAYDKKGQYVPEKGFSCSLLVDAQNVYRY